MIYANEYGTVDLLSEQFLQSLKSDKGTIAVSYTHLTLPPPPYV